MKENHEAGEEDSDESPNNNKLSLREPLLYDKQWQRHEHSMNPSKSLNMVIMLEVFGLVV